MCDDRRRMTAAAGSLLRLSVLRRHHRQGFAVRQGDRQPRALENEGLAVVQGSAFELGPAFRISYATKTSDLEDPASASSAFVAICDSQITSSSNS